MRLRVRVDNWRFFMVVAYVGIGAAMFIGYKALQRTTREEAKAKAAEVRRATEAKANAIQRVSTCFVAVKNAPVTRGFVTGQDALIENGIISNRESLAIQGGDPKIRAVREEALKRLLIAKANNEILRALLEQKTPTKKSCIRLAVQTHVPFKQFLRKPSQP